MKPFTGRHYFLNIAPFNKCIQSLFWMKHYTAYSYNAVNTLQDGKRINEGRVITAQSSTHTQLVHFSQNQLYMAELALYQHIADLTFNQYMEQSAYVVLSDS